MKALLHLKGLLALLFCCCFLITKAQTSCGTDTIYYTYNKTTQFRAVALNASSSGSSFGQWYPAPQPLVISGFEFYAWQSAGTNALVTLTCNLYRATADSLPLGSPLRTVNITIDSTFGSGVLTTLRKSVIFSSPISMNTPYIITVETSSSTNVSVICSDYASPTPNGQKEWLSTVKISGNYLRPYNVNVGGIPFDADFILQPYVSYALKADYIFAGCNTVGNTINFTNKSSAVINNRFYSLYAFYNITQFCHMWDYGDTTGIYYDINGSHAYSERVSHQVTLKDTLYGWRSGCSNKEVKTVYHVPLPPTPTNDGPHCSGDTLKFFADSTVGISYTWSGPKGFASTLRNPVIPISDTSHKGQYTVKATVGTCTSADSTTMVTIYQTPKDPLAGNDGSKCVGDTAHFTANSPSPGLTYYWEGPNGFLYTGDSFSIDGVDTSIAGNYTVYAKDSHCSTGPDTATLHIYPPPMPPAVSVVKDSVCEGDTVYLVGNSVVGAVFNWKGPDGFTSATAKPFIPHSKATTAGYYIANVIIGSCTSQADSVAVGIHSLPITGPITGSDTSTESLKKAYAVTGSSNSSFYWTVQGGAQVSGDSSNAINILWGTPGTGNISVLEKNKAGCSGTPQLYVVTISKKPDPDPEDSTHVGIKELAGTKIKIYPNPAGHTLYTDFETFQTAVAITVTDLLGKTLISLPAIYCTGKCTQAIDISALAPGIYMLHFETGGQKKTLRFVADTQ